MLKRSSTTFLKIVLILMAILVLVGLIYFPQTEGRAKNLDLISIYADPFILYLYIASVPFFIALLQSFKLLEYIEKNKIFTQIAVNALRNIKYCAMAIVSFLVVAMIWARLAAGDDDPAGAMAVGIVLTFATSVVGVAAAVFQKLLQSAVDLKEENDLTV